MYYYVLHVTQYIDFFFQLSHFQRVKKQEIMYVLANKTSYIIKTAAYILMHQQQAINNTSIA